MSNFSTGRSAARRARKRQEAMIAQQERRERIRLDEQEDEIKRRTSAATRGFGGRRSLIRNIGGESGLSEFLG